MIGTESRVRRASGRDPLACEVARSHGVTDGLLYITNIYNDRVLLIVPWAFKARSRSVAKSGVGFDNSPETGIGVCIP